MTSQNILELAKQGDLKAITTLMSRQLQPKGISVKTTLANGCLTVSAESEDAPEKAFLVEFIRKGISNLKVGVIKRVVVQGHVTGKATPAWRESFDLQSAATPAQKQPVSISISPIGSSVNSLKPEMKISRSHRLTNILSVTKGSWELINIVLLLAILLVLIANLFVTNKSQPTLWEYRIESVEDSVFDQEMQRMGSEGWELASARRAVAGEDSSSRGLYECIFKRPATKAHISEND